MMFSPNRNGAIVLSCFNKMLLEPAIPLLKDISYDIFASKGTYAYLTERGVRSLPMEAYSRVGQGSKCKSLLQEIHEGIFLSHKSEDQLTTKDGSTIQPIHLVFCDIYPQDFVLQNSTELNLDVGGPSMLLNAARNYRTTYSICRGQDFVPSLISLNDQFEYDLDKRKELAKYTLIKLSQYLADSSMFFEENASKDNIEEQKSPQGLKERNCNGLKTIHTKFPFIHLLKKGEILKTIHRSNYISNSIRFENVAEHSWQAVYTCLVLANYAKTSTNISRCVEMLIVHDIVEAYIGDVCKYSANVDLIAELERDALKVLKREFPKHVYALIEEFHNRETNESKFANAIDMIMPLISNVLTDGTSWKGFSIDKKTYKNSKRRIAEGSDELWIFANHLIDYSVDRGWIKN